MKTLDKLKSALDQKQENMIQEEIIGELKGHNLLADLQEKEKALAAELKNLKLELQNEKGFYKVEMKEKKILAQKYKEDLNKAETESMIRNTYQVGLTRKKSSRPAKSANNASSRKRKKTCYARKSKSCRVWTAKKGFSRKRKSTWSAKSSPSKRK